MTYYDLWLIMTYPLSSPIMTGPWFSIFFSPSSPRGALWEWVWCVVSRTEQETPNVDVNGWVNKRKGAFRDGAPGSLKVWMRKAWKARTVGLLAFTHCCWCRLFYKQLNNEEESPNIFEEQGWELKKERIFVIAHTPFCFSRTGEKSWHPRSCVFSWPPGGSMAQLSETNSVLGHP